MKSGFYLTSGILPQAKYQKWDKNLKILMLNMYQWSLLHPMNVELQAILKSMQKLFNKERVNEKVPMSVPILFWTKPMFNMQHHTQAPCTNRCCEGLSKGHILAPGHLMEEILHTFSYRQMGELWTLFEFACLQHLTHNMVAEMDGNRSRVLFCSTIFSKLNLNGIKFGKIKRKKCCRPKLPQHLG